MQSRFHAASTADEVLSGTNLAGKRFLITGVTSGIRLETARALAARGASIVGTSLHPDQAEQATAPIRAAAEQGGGSLELIELDLGALHSVHAASRQLLADGRHIDALIANAGIMATPFGRTADGFERQFGTNYLGHFALARQVEPLLADGGRLIVVSSQAHRIADVDLDDPNFERQPYDPWVAYARSKTAAALLAVAFDQQYRGHGIRAAAVMPGNSAGTSLTRHLPSAAVQGLLDQVAQARAKAGLAPAMLKSVPQAAATPVWAAVIADPDAIGGHYLEDCAVAAIDDTPNPFADGARSYALDSGAAHRLWLESEAWIDAAR